MFTESSTNARSYSVQFHSDPRSLHGDRHQRRSRRFMSTSIPSTPSSSTSGSHSPSPSNQAQTVHPYIAAQQKLKSNASTESVEFETTETTNTHSSSSHRPLRLNQAICSRSPMTIHCGSRRNLKRKYKETFDDSKEGRAQYEQSINTESKMKQRVTEQMMMRSMRACNVRSGSLSTDFGLTSTSTSTDSVPTVTVRSRKRTLSMLKAEALPFDECKDDGDTFSDLEPLIKRMRVSECSEPSIEFESESQSDLELIPKRIEFAEYPDDTLLATLCRKDSVLQRMSLNGRSGALVKYEAPSKSWKDLVQRYFENGRRCDVQEFTAMNGDGTVIERHSEEEQQQQQFKEKKKRKSVRLHSSYAGFSSDRWIGNEDLKQIANRCYAKKMGSKQKEPNMEEQQGGDGREAMECD